MNGQSARPKLHGQVRIFEAAGRELQAGMEPVTTEPAPVEDASFAGARRLYPAQCLGSFAAVVGGKQEVPYPQDRNRADDVDD